MAGKNNVPLEMISDELKPYVYSRSKRTGAATASGHDIFIFNARFRI